MNKMKLVRHTTNAATQVYINVTKPTSPIPAKAKDINIDPATGVAGNRYPIPSFFEYRIKPKTYDPL